MTNTTPSTTRNVSNAARDAYRHVIGALLTTRALPDVATLPADALRELQAADWLGFGSDGQIVAPYPFALEQTDVAIHLDGEAADAWHPVMCAVDALGVAPMLGRTVDVRSVCRQTGQPINVRVRPDGIASREPRSSVVIRRRTSGPAHLNRCAATRFAAAPHLAQQWIDAHGTADDVIQSLEAAFIEGTAIFGHRLHQSS